MKLKLFFIFLPLTILSNTNYLNLKTPEEIETHEESYKIAKNFLEAALEFHHQINSSSQEDPNVTEFKLALQYFGEFSKSGDFLSMNRIVIWLENHIAKFKEDFFKEGLKEEIYDPILNEIGISCAVGAIVYVHPTDVYPEEIEFNTMQIDRVLTKYLKLLVKNGANINHLVNNAKIFVKSDSQWTKINGSLLHICASTDRDDLINLLIALGSKLELLDTNGRTALHIAIECCKDDKIPHVIEALVKNGSDVNSEYGSGIKPLKLAIQKKLMKVASVLKQNGANQKSEELNNRSVSFFGFFS